MSIDSPEWSVFIEISKVDVAEVGSYLSVLFLEWLYLSLLSQLALFAFHMAIWTLSCIAS